VKPFDAHLHLGTTAMSGGCVAAGDPAELGEVERFARAHGLHLALGVHPWWAHSVDVAAELDALRTVPLDAVGEFGLDPLRGEARAQERSVRLQVAFASERDLPVVLHCVRAHDRLLTLLAPRHEGLVHAWTGSAQQARRFVARGLCVSFGKALLRSSKIQAAAVIVPDDYLLLESDGPGGGDLLPVAECLAGLRGWSTADLVRKTDQNARRVFPRDTRTG
jgi:TatD DNase family protein